MTTNSNRRTNPRAQKGPTLQERLAQEQAELAAAQKAPLQEEGEPTIGSGNLKEEENMTEVEQPPRATDELEPVAFVGQREHQLPTPSDALPVESELTSTLPQQSGARVIAQETVKDQELSSTEGMRPGAADERVEAVPAPGFPYIVERKQLSARIDKRLIKAMQHFAIDRERNDYEVWEEAAKAFLLENGVKWSKAGEAL